MAHKVYGSFENIPPSIRQHNLWARTLKLNQNGWEWDFSLTNELGPVFPALADDLMIELLGIAVKDRVIDIGGGDACFSRANVVTDAFINSNVHRSGRVLRQLHGTAARFEECFAEQLPFADQEFDFAYSRSVFEHTIDPAAACSEMMRVARRGFIETPTPLAEYLGGHPTHRWIVYIEKSNNSEPVLVFKRKPFVRAPFSYLLRPLFFNDNDFHFRWEWKYRNLVTTQFAWEGSFRFRIDDDLKPGYMDYDVPEAAAAAHLDCAVSAIQYGNVPLDVIKPDIDVTLALTPLHAEAYNAKGCMLFFAGERNSAVECFNMATHLDPRVDLYQQNLVAATSSVEAPVIRVVEDAYALPEMKSRDLIDCMLDAHDLEVGLVLLLNGLMASGSPRIRHIKERFTAVKALSQQLNTKPAAA